MTTHRRAGLTLLEVLGGLVLVSTFLLVSGPALKTVMDSYRYAARAGQITATASSLAAWLRKDLQAGVDLPDGWNGRECTQKYLIIRQTDGIVAYSATPDAVRRQWRGHDGRTATASWPLTGAEVHFAREAFKGHSSVAWLTIQWEPQDSEIPSQRRSLSTAIRLRGPDGGDS